MARPRKTIPTLCETSRGYLFAKDRDGNQHWFGHKSDPRSGDKYADFIARIQRGDLTTQAKRPPKDRPMFSVNELCVQFLAQYATRYRNADGSPSAEVRCFLSAIAHLRPPFGKSAANDFGPLRLRIVRQSMVDAGWSRRWINKQIKRVQLIFRFGVSMELVRSDVLQALEAVPALTFGETSAPESKPRRSIPEADLESVRSVLGERHRDIFDLMLLTGCRPGELLGLTSGGIDRSGEVWRADLEKHKTAHKEKSRTLFFNSTAQLILRKYLKADPTARLFPLRVDTLSNAIKAACEIAFGMPDHLRKPGRKLTPAERSEAKAWRRKHVWTSHWLRHTVATRIADELGTEAAQRLLGHASRAMTEHYSKKAERQAIEAAKKLG